MFKDGLIKGVFVFFLGVFVGTFGFKHFRPGSTISESELLMRLAQQQQERKVLLTEIQDVLNGSVQLSQSAQDNNLICENAKTAVAQLTSIFDEYLDIRSPLDQQKRSNPEKLEGYQKYDSEGKILPQQNDVEKK